MISAAIASAPSVYPIVALLIDALDVLPPVTGQPCQAYERHRHRRVGKEPPLLQRLPEPTSTLMAERERSQTPHEITSNLVSVEK